VISGGNDRTLLYIAGLGRSGSTLLSMVLNTHAEIFAIGEMKSPRRHECSCGKAVEQCPFMLEMVERLGQAGMRLDPGEWNLEYRREGHWLADRLLFQSLRSDFLENLRDAICGLWPPHRRALADLDFGIRQFVAAALDISGRRIFVDATKSPLRIRHLRRIAGDTLKVIHLVRDPRGVTFSQRHLGEAEMRKVPIGWRHVNLGVERHLQALPRERWMRVRYESLCADPASTLASIGTFLGVGPIEVPTNFRAGEHHLQAGNAARKQSDTRVSIEIDERWRTELSPSILEHATRVAATLARRYGYSDI
jgi:hypothetical protein